MISVIVATFGDRDRWYALALRALDSADTAQTTKPAEIFYVHAETLAVARNKGAEKATSDWLIFLDADDELDPGYIEAMTQASDAIDHLAYPPLFQPRTLGVHPDGSEDDTANFIEPRVRSRGLAGGNHLIIGTMVNRSLFHKVGGFWEWPAWEDWCLWWRCTDAGAQIVRVPDAIYRVHVNPDSRNAPMAPADAGRLATDIRRRHREWLSARG